jgi:sec-independent protein translocase protein TatA
MGFMGGSELLIILAIVILLFGAKKIPDLASGLGKGIREFKKASRGDEDKKELEDKVDEKK